MTKDIFWIHDKSLNMKILDNLNPQIRPVFIWDDMYFKRRGYSLKRLVFIYESLCALPVEIIRGDIIEILLVLNPKKIKALYSVDSEIVNLTSRISEKLNVELIKPKKFVQVSDKFNFKRFFNYWNKAKKTAFLNNGLPNA
ncbi:MAG: hypothetical protein MK132_25140 [Lentisphaerales bacterium]|nr:hypothetical protein [Lentisphaerales bacterium]